MGAAPSHEDSIDENGVAVKKNPATALPSSGMHLNDNEDVGRLSSSSSMSSRQEPVGRRKRAMTGSSVRFSVRGSIPQLEPGSLITVGNSMRTVEEVKEAIGVITAKTKNDESLPAPWHETEMKISQYLAKNERNKTVPLECPQRSPSVYASEPISFSNDTEYLERLYNIRTWNMHKLISDARQDYMHSPSIAPYCYNYNKDFNHNIAQECNDMIFDME